MTNQLLEREVLDEPAAEGERPAIGSEALSRPYAAPIVASFALDSLDVESGAALTANG